MTGGTFMNQTSQQPGLKEKQSHGTRLFPCAYYHFSNLSYRLRVRHHWHEEVEVVYLQHGQLVAGSRCQRFH